MPETNIESDVEALIVDLNRNMALLGDLLTECGWLNRRRRPKLGDLGAR
jgi:hypothetical protein